MFMANNAQHNVCCIRRPWASDNLPEENNTAVVHNRRTIGQEDKRETTVKQYNITSTVLVKLYMVAEQGSWQRQSRWAPIPQHSTNTHTHNSKRRRQALTPQEVACDNDYGNNGSSSTGRRSITSSARRQSGQHEQIQTQAPLLQWRLQHVWRMEVQVHSIHGPTRQWLHSTTTSSRGCQCRADRSTTTRSSNNNWGWWTTCSPQHRLEVHPHQHNNWGSSNSLPTIPAHNWLRNVQTTLHTILNTTRHKINWTPYTATQTQIRQQQFRGVILNMGIWAPTLWAWQWTTIARCGKNSSATQWDNRTTTTTPTTTLRTKPKLRQSQSNNHWILQIDNSI